MLHLRAKTLGYGQRLLGFLSGNGVPLWKWVRHRAKIGTD